MAGVLTLNDQFYAWLKANGITKNIDELTLDLIMTWYLASPGGGQNFPGYIYLDDYSGTDDQKLAAAMAAANAATNPPIIKFSNRDHSFSVAQTMYDGFAIEGLIRPSNAEKTSNSDYTPVKCDINVAAGVWLTSATGTYTWDVYIAGFAFEGHQTVQFMANTNSGLNCGVIRDVSFNSFKSVLGSQATKLALTACHFDGYWEVNNSYNGAIHIGGSDNDLWTNGILLDSSLAFGVAGSATGQYHLWTDFLEKTSLGIPYITCEGLWGGWRNSGPTYNPSGSPSNLGGPNTMMAGARIEGRNAGSGSNGNLIRVDGGIAVVDGIWLGYGMISPATQGHSPQDAGIIHVTDGMLLADNITYDRATGVAESVPVIYVSGTGNAKVGDIIVGSKGGQWTSRPVITDASTGVVLRSGSTFCNITGDITTGSAVLANATGLALVVEPGTWEFEFFIPYTGSLSASAPFTLVLNGPTASFVSSEIYFQNSTTGKAEQVQTAFGVSYVGPNVTTGGSVYLARIIGTAVVTALGTLQVQYASDGTHTNTIKAGAYGRATLIG